MFVIDDAIEEYAFQHTRQEPELLQQLSSETRESIEYPQMLTGRLEGRFLKMLVELTQAHFVLEIGTFTGYSALSMAEGLPSDGRIVTCDVNPICSGVAERYFAESPHGNKIEFRKEPGLAVIASLNDPIDLAFVDADKENYPNYYDALIEKVKSGGLMLFDNALWSGRVLDPPDEESRRIAELNKNILQDDRVENVLLTVRDGIHVVRKK